MDHSSKSFSGVQGVELLQNSQHIIGIGTDTQHFPQLHSDLSFDPSNLFIVVLNPMHQIAESSLAQIKHISFQEYLVSFIHFLNIHELVVLLIIADILLNSALDDLLQLLMRPSHSEKQVQSIIEHIQVVDHHLITSFLFPDHISADHEVIVPLIVDHIELLMDILIKLLEFDVHDILAPQYFQKLFNEVSAHCFQ